ncbi:MAG: hypothetical protein QM642_01815 [Edaphocola sp.]
MGNNIFLIQYACIPGGYATIVEVDEKVSKMEMHEQYEVVKHFADRVFKKWNHIGFASRKNPIYANAKAIGGIVRDYRPIPMFVSKLK